MVKVVRQLRREAAVEAEKRTISLSKKSLVGQPLIDPAHESSRSAGAVFNSERFIYGQIRPLLVRGADRPSWYEMATKSGALITHSDRVVEQGAGGAVASVLSSSLVSKLAFAEVLRCLSALEIVLFLDVSSHSLGIDRDHDCTEYRDSLMDANQSATRMKGHGLRWFVASDAAANQSHKGKASISDQGIFSAGYCCWNNITENLWCFLIEDCFGTAPIWFQQSMATGPPTNQCSLRK